MVPARTIARKTSPVSGPNQHAWIRALDRARLVSTRKPIYVIRTDSYRVYSARAAKEYSIHRVEVDGILSYECDCRAGEDGQVCWHAALVAALPGECARRRNHPCPMPSPVLEAPKHTYVPGPIISLHTPSPLDALFA